MDRDAPIQLTVQVKDAKVDIRARNLKDREIYPVQVLSCNGSFACFDMTVPSTNHTTRNRLRAVSRRRAVCEVTREEIWFRQPATVRPMLNSLSMRRAWLCGVWWNPTGECPVSVRITAVGRGVSVEVFDHLSQRALPLVGRRWKGGALHFRVLNQRGLILTKHRLRGISRRRCLHAITFADWMVRCGGGSHRTMP